MVLLRILLDVTGSSFFWGGELNDATRDNVRQSYQWKIQDGGWKTAKRKCLQLRPNLRYIDTITTVRLVFSETWNAMVQSLLMPDIDVCKKFKMAAKIHRKYL